MVVSCVGIAVAVSGKGDLAVNRAALIGALCGLGVALALATTFVTLRRAPELPLLPALGTGAFLAMAGSKWLRLQARFSLGSWGSS